jgi:hypothetical protein
MREVLRGHALEDRVAKMQSQGLITTEFKAAMSYVRLIRNIGAHAGQPVRPESAEGTMRFTQRPPVAIRGPRGAWASDRAIADELGDGEDERDS